MRGPLESPRSHACFWKNQIPEIFLITICAKPSLFHCYRLILLHQRVINTINATIVNNQFNMGKPLAVKK